MEYLSYWLSIPKIIFSTIKYDFSRLVPGKEQGVIIDYI